MINFPYHNAFLHMSETKLVACLTPLLQLLQHPDIDLDIQTLFGTTMLHEFVLGMHVLSVKILLSYGADMYIPDNNGKTAIGATENHIILEQLFANTMIKQEKLKMKMEKQTQKQKQNKTTTTGKDEMKTKGENVTKLSDTNNILLTHESSDMCDICGKASKVDQHVLFKCQGCLSRTYCSKKCQKFDWRQNGHYLNCKQKQEHLKQTKELEFSGKNRLDLSFNVQSEAKVDLQDSDEFQGLYFH